ncbi:MAG: aspartate/glutamate racemase family protein, partial [Candidatus Obscuribacterales bacterium]|nr:aspartate/glutamate racemase family protein [Candidatus Obscuribacterales bacterium]
AQGKQKIGVLATNSTVKSQAFSKAIKEFTNDLEVIEIGCPELVGIVESGQINSEATSKTLSKYASQLEKAGVDSVVLGCTHYPFLAGPLSALLPAHVQLVDPAALMVRSLSKNKPSNPSLNEDDNKAEISKEIYVTGPLADFAASAQICLGQAPGTIYGITIQDLQAARSVALQTAPATADISGTLS